MGDEVRVVNKNEMIAIIINALNFIDERLVLHGERVAYIAYEICNHPKLKEEVNMDVLMLLCFFHDIGAYKTEDINRMIQFENGDVHEHATYGYLFLKYFSPLKEYAQAILYHHTRYHDIPDERVEIKLYASLLHLADRIDILLMDNDFCSGELRTILTQNKHEFDIELVTILLDIFEEKNIDENIKTGAFLEVIKGVGYNIEISLGDIINYAEMLAYTIDFRSENTVVHTITTTRIAFEISQIMGLSKVQCQKVFFGALLHDIGKIAIPLSILEFSGKLDQVQMNVMKNHVKYTEYIISGVISTEIYNIAVRHHEKLDGSGYPYALTEKDLNLEEKIVAVADIMSALISKRSYKEKYSKQHTLTILDDLKCKNKLDSSVIDAIFKNFDFIMEKINEKTQPVLNKYQQMTKEYPVCLNQLLQHESCTAQSGVLNN